ncbi:methionyl-tRNA formyltransferase [Corynebacterium heidelbergense]|uniref:Methionyl-tRNA formyltransferase n=1 Tax=Corynebacterium heidelbergense TaxID=2055947 RepID=A0A364VBV7_9CORY|nr:methionyl-tRNA formyltransferase [Corynebacterium heidelbergense]RAV34101.1 methionyl-tRNA formyltransferase [Corynebacterium heidelbergense]WCZ36592.1 Methionyl-tRNA formyltransferase [Corynebacterium heidelbergense]
MKILFAGTPEPAAAALRTLAANPRLEILGVLTQPDARTGRGRKTRPSAVAQAAAELGLPVHKWASLAPSAPEAEEVRRHLRDYAEHGVHAIAVVAYGTLIPADLLGALEHGWINLHFSLLPRWRGAAPVQAAIAAGDETTGASIFRIARGLDTGDVLATAPAPIGSEVTAGELLEELTELGAPLLAQALLALEEGTATLRPQPKEGATHAPKITAADAQIDWSRPAGTIHRRCRAHTPAPGAWTLADQERFKIGALTPVDPQAQLPALQPGQVHAAKNAVYVGTGSDPLELLSLQPPAKKMMNAADWARGQQSRLAAGLRFAAAPEQEEN